MEPPWPSGKQKRLGDFSAPQWEAIHFAPDGPVQYVYFTDAFPFPSPYPVFRPPEFDITNDPPTDISIAFQVAAAGDIDGDGKFSRFERSSWLPVGKSEFQSDGIVFAQDDLE